MYPRLQALSRITLVVVMLFMYSIISSLITPRIGSPLTSSLSSTFTSPSILMNFMDISTDTEDEQTLLDDKSIWCLDMIYRLENERQYLQPPVFKVPSIKSSKLRHIPYHYSFWKSSPLLPRRLSPCEHNLLMRLMMIIERICRKYNITFMIYDGSLLGSWRHHDIIPWDDDIDIMISINEKSNFLRILKKMNKTLLQHHVFLNSQTNREYYKIFFQNTPSAGRYPWNYPFIDVFFYDKNKTHLWKIAEPDTTAKLEYIFPLVIRPFGQLWLPSPRKPLKLFQFDLYDQCNGHYYDHRNERRLKEIKHKCNELKHIYPFVERNNRSNSIEILRIDHTIIQTILYN